MALKSNRFESLCQFPVLREEVAYIFQLTKFTLTPEKEDMEYENVFGNK